MLVLLVLATTVGGPRIEAKPITEHVLRGVVRNDAGQPIANARITLAGVDALTRSDARGAFSLPLEKSAEWSLDVSADGYATARLRGLEEAGMELSVRLRRPVLVTGTIAAPDAKGGSLRVFDAPPVMVGEPGAMWSRLALPLQVAQLSATGAFSFELAAGHYVLEWTRPDGRRCWLPFQAPAQELVLRPPSAVVTGSVVDASGKPVAGVPVQLRGLEGATKTDSAGRFRFERLLPQAFLVSASTGDACDQMFVSASDEPRAITLRLGALTFTGRVVGDDGQPLAGIAVRAETSCRYEPFERNVTAADGTFTVRSANPSAPHVVLATTKSARSVAASATAGTPVQIIVPDRFR